MNKPSRILEASLDEKVKYLSQWVDSHIHDGDEILKKPVLFTEVGSSLHQNQQELYQRDIFLKTVYDKIYESANICNCEVASLLPHIDSNLCWKSFIHRLIQHLYPQVPVDRPFHFCVTNSLSDILKLYIDIS